MIYFYSLLRVAFVLAAAVALAKPARTQSAAAIVAELESLYLKGEGVAATFAFGSENAVELTVALRSQKYKLETAEETIVNDGAVVRRLNKTRNEVVLDYAQKKNSPASAPADLFNFSSNYSVKLLSSKGNTYSLQLTPKPQITEVFKQAEITNLIFDLQRPAKGKPLQVISITASGKGAKRKVTDVVIAPVMKFDGNEFNFTSPKGAKVIDLTEE